MRLIYSTPTFNGVVVSNSHCDCLKIYVFIAMHKNIRTNTRTHTHRGDNNVFEEVRFFFIRFICWCALYIKCVERLSKENKNIGGGFGCQHGNNSLCKLKFSYFIKSSNIKYFQYIDLFFYSSVLLINSSFYLILLELCRYLYVST